MKIVGKRKETESEGRHILCIFCGCVFDLTSEQFGDEALDYSNCTEQFRERHFAKEENGCGMNICGGGF